MKNIILLFSLIYSLSLQSQELTWHTDMNKAVEIATKENKVIMLFFTGSDWCGWCVRLQNEVFKKPEFAAWANEKVVLVELDFPKKTAQSEALKTQNSSLSQMFEIRGYPTAWFVKAVNIDGKINLEKKLRDLNYSYNIF